MVPPGYSIHHDSQAIDASPTASPTTSGLSRSTVESRTSQRTQSSEIEPYPLDLPPTLDPNSKEVREHLGLFPKPFLFSTPIRPAIDSRAHDKKASKSAIWIDKGKKKESPAFDDDGSATPLRRRPLSLGLSEPDASSSTPTLASPTESSSHPNFPTTVARIPIEGFQGHALDNVQPREQSSYPEE